MILLDTCTLLWLAADQAKLSEAALLAIKAHKQAIFVSSISAFEIGVKFQKKKLQLPMPPYDWFSKAVKLHALTEVYVNGKIAASSTELPNIHNDPVDRMIVSTAMFHNFQILTPDEHVHEYPNVNVLW